MIEPITKKEYKRVRSLQRLSLANVGMVFIGYDKKCYRTDLRGVDAAREIFDFNFELRHADKDQQSLLDVII